MLNRLDFARPRSIIGWAMVAGIAAGLLAATYMFVVAEPIIDDAIAIEDARIAAEEHHAAEPEQVSRGDQRGPGLFSFYAVQGAAYGLIMSVTALSLRRGSWLDPFRRVVVAGTIIAGAVTLAPWLKYPPNPPAVGDPATAAERQQLYWLLIALTGAVLAGLAYLSGRMRATGWDEARRIAALAAAGLVAFGVLVAVMPPNPDSIPSEVPANLIWQFRLASLGGNLLFWALLTVGFGALCAEAARRRAADTAAAAAVEGADQNSMPFRAEMPLS